jgi:DNA-directed RNA polymerase III subunit RPC1
MQTPQRTPTVDGVLDQRLGVSNKRGRCHTCGLGLKDCAGHFGLVKLPLPVFHPVRCRAPPWHIVPCYPEVCKCSGLTLLGALIPLALRCQLHRAEYQSECTISGGLRLQGYFTATIKILQSVCKACGRVLLTDKQRAAFLRTLHGRRGRERNANRGAHKAILAECKKARQCPRCLAHNGPVKKMAASFKVLHDPFAKKVRVTVSPPGLDVLSPHSQMMLAAGNLHGTTDCRVYFCAVRVHCARSQRPPCHAVSAMVDAIAGVI